MGNALPVIVSLLPHVVDLVKVLFKPGVAPAPKPGVAEETKEQVHSQRPHTGIQ